MFRKGTAGSFLLRRPPRSPRGEAEVGVGNRRGRAWRQRSGCELGFWQETAFAQMVLMKRKLQRGGSIRATFKR